MMLAGALLVAVQLRLTVTSVGKPLGEDYAAQPVALYGLLALAALLAGQVGVARQVVSFFASTALATVLILFLLPDVSQLQVVYFFMTALLLAFFLLVIPQRLYRTTAMKPALMTELHALYQRRYLFFLWLKYRIQIRYTQTVLGILWIVLLPLLTSAVLAFAIGEILGARLLVDVPYVPFILAGQLMFNLFSNVILSSRNALLNMMPVANQIYFPREITILLVVGEALVDFFFTLVAMLIINALYGIFPTVHYLWLPVPILLMLILTLGMALMISWLGILIRDLQQLIAIGLQLLFFLSPVLYSIDRIPVRYRFLATINPLSPIIDAFHTIVIYGRPPDLLPLYIPTVLAGVFLYLGYVFYKSNESRFADYV